jgi:uncharacterized protein YjbJ (UPF0337 family)
MDKDRIAGSAKDFAGKVEGAVGGIAGDAKTQAAGAAQNLYGETKDAARDASDAAVRYAKGAYENSGDTFREGSQAIAKAVQDNPLGSLVIAGVIGFAMAFLMRPGRRPAPRGRYYN